MEHYIVDRVIADAIYGQVLLAREKNSLDFVAIKRVNIESSCAHKTLRGDHKFVEEDIEIEKHVHSILDGNHRHILRMRSSFIEDGWDHLVFDYCSDGDLFEKLGHGSLSDRTIRRYLHQIAGAVQFMHHSGVAHRDLSLENVLLHNDTCYVCDFGLATPTAQQCDDAVGKPFYMAPEILRDMEYDPAKADVWSLGIMMFMLLTGVPMYQVATPSDSRFAYLMHHGLRSLLQMWGKELQSDAVNLLEGMLCINPKKRWNMQQVLHHEYFQQQGSMQSECTIDKLPSSTTRAFAFVNRIFKRRIVDVAVV